MVDNPNIVTRTMSCF